MSIRWCELDLRVVEMLSGYLVRICDIVWRSLGAFRCNCACFYWRACGIGVSWAVHFYVLQSALASEPYRYTKCPHVLAVP